MIAAGRPPVRFPVLLCLPLLFACAVPALAGELVVRRAPVQMVQATADAVTVRSAAAIANGQGQEFHVYFVLRRSEASYLCRADGTPILKAAGTLRPPQDAPTARFDDLRATFRREDLQNNPELPRDKTTVVWICCELWDPRTNTFAGSGWPSRAGLAITRNAQGAIVRMAAQAPQPAITAGGGDDAPTAPVAAVPPFQHKRPYVLTRRERAFIEQVKAQLDDPEAIDRTGPRGMTALHRAAAQNFKTAAEFLIQQGAQLNPRDKQGNTPLAIAAASGHSHVAEVLLRHGAAPNLAATNAFGVEQTPLALATEARDDAMAELLRTYGASAVAIPGAREQAAHEADRELKKSFQETVKRAIEAQRLDIRLGDRDSTLLHVAAEQGWLAELRQLLKAGADPNAKDATGQTPLFRAVAEGHDQAMMALIRGGARVEIQDNDGNTPVHVAQAAGDTQAVRTLQWAAIAASSRQQLEWWQGAAQQQMEQTRQWGVARPGGAVLPGGMFAAATDEQALAQAQQALRAGQPVEAPDPLGRTRLIRAVQTGHVNTAAFLLERGANVHATFMLGTTPLHLAAQSGNNQMVKLLLRHGANPAARNQLGSTPADLARQGGHAATAELLQRSGR
jgi:ankyrin repeat protein